MGKRTINIRCNGLSQLASLHSLNEHSPMQGSPSALEITQWLSAKRDSSGSHSPWCK